MIQKPLNFLPRSGLLFAILASPIMLSPILDCLVYLRFLILKIMTHQIQDRKWLSQDGIDLVATTQGLWVPPMSVDASISVMLVNIAMAPCF